jgi:hypothetical protein
MGASPGPGWLRRWAAGWPSARGCGMRSRSPRGRFASTSDNSGVPIVVTVGSQLPGRPQQVPRPLPAAGCDLPYHLTGENRRAGLSILLRARRITSAWISARRGSTPRSAATSCVSWPPWPSASPPLYPGPIPITVHEVRQLLATAVGPRTHPATPPAGFSGDAATRHDPAGITSVHAWNATN